MRSLGEFFGHVWKGVKTDPAKGDRESVTVRKSIKEEDRGDMTLRRTIIEEIEFRNPKE